VRTDVFAEVAEGGEELGAAVLVTVERVPRVDTLVGAQPGTKPAWRCHKQAT